MYNIKGSLFGGLSIGNMVNVTDKLASLGINTNVPIYDVPVFIMCTTHAASTL